MNHEEIRKTLDAATPGPWKIDHWPRTHDFGIECNAHYVAILSKKNENRHNDAHLIANAPTWLRSLLDEVEKYKRLYVNAQEELDVLHSQLAERDKVLEWYADKSNHAPFYPMIMLQDCGEKARSILSRYEVNT